LPRKGCLIVFEGIEGSGKTTVSKKLAKYLTDKKYKVMWTREPNTNSKIGSLIENILLGKVTVAEEAIPLLFAADRADHTIRVINPAIEKGFVVISDRYLHSSLAYQQSGMETNFGRDWLEKINRYSVNPDLVIFLDITPEEGLNRIGKWQRIHDDKFFEDVETQKQIRKAYYEILNLNMPLTGLFGKDLLPSPFLSKVKGVRVVGGVTVIALDASLDQSIIQDAVNETAQRFLRSKGIEKQPENSGRTSTLV
jgi:dTMP kinase